MAIGDNSSYNELAVEVDIRDAAMSVVRRELLSCLHLMRIKPNDYFAELCLSRIKKIVMFYFLATGAGGDLTLFDNHAKPSSKPSPVKAQDGTTYHTLSFSLSSCRAAVTSCTFISARGKTSSSVNLSGYLRRGFVTYGVHHPACSQKLGASNPSFRDH